jgi:hypothetical protein
MGMSRHPDATDNPAFWAYSICRIALHVFVCLGHFFLWVFIKSCAVTVSYEFGTLLSRYAVDLFDLATS